MEFYWHLIKWDNEIILVKPQNAEYVQSLLSKGDGFIRTPDRSIAVKDIKDFVVSGESYTDQKVIDGALQAFNNPVINEDGSIKSVWVKRGVSQREFEKKFSYGSYKILSSLNGYIMMAYKIPIHLMNNEVVEECSPQEVLRMSS